jgi:hypothetical protein
MVGGAGAGFVTVLIQNGTVQTELKMTDEQIERAIAWGRQKSRKMSDALRSQADELQDKPREERAEKAAALRDVLNAAAIDEVGKLLKPEQIKRLRQIDLQLAGLAGFQRPAVATALKLTTEQRKVIGEIVDTAQKEQQSLLGGTFGPGAQPIENVEVVREAVDEIRKKAADKINGKLTDDQKKAWKELLGKPFDGSKSLPPNRKKD